MELLEDRAEILRRAQGDLALHIYEIGDLDPFFWPHCRFYGGAEDSLAMVYTGMSPATLLAFGRGDGLTELVDELATTLPDELYCHASPPVESVLGTRYSVRSRGDFHKMVLGELAPAPSTGEAVVPLGPDDLDEVLAFYTEAYPDNYFDPRMLELDCYLGIRREGRLSAVAGVHVYSPEYRVAALGNIATGPWARGQGLARAVTHALCRQLQPTTKCIGLNVKQDNEAALRCYRALGFEIAADYVEMSVRR